MAIEEIKSGLGGARGREWLQMNRDKMFFWISLIMLIVVMSVWWEMFCFAKSTVRWPRWSLDYFMYPFIFTSDVVFVALLPVVIATKSFRMACYGVVKCVFVSSLIPAFMASVDMNGQVLFGFAVNYMFVLIFHCWHPIIFAIILRLMVFVFYKMIGRGMSVL